MSHIRLSSVSIISSNSPFFAGLSIAIVVGSAAANLVSADEKPDADRSAIVIRPANYDPADELAYTRRRGEVEPGMSASGKLWNKPAEDSRAAVSDAAVAPAPEAANHGAPVSAASGKPALRMTYAEAYAQIPFKRSEYEANPGYRHDAAMELMFGVLRPTITSRQSLPYFSRYPDMFRYRYPVYPYPSSSGDPATLNMNWNTSLIAY